MNSKNTAFEQTRIYQCEPQVRQALQSVGNHLHQLCARHANRLVKVETVHGDVFEGRIVHCDRGILYLSQSNEGYDRAFFPSPSPPNAFNDLVLPLVLFNLLTISLL
ncbi:hypothetical protein [Cohnella cholangitidis]|uniref:Uncharacterized protein n=1 Tax=Cohnella cholangitidis TaxID=2598458 RepID=A0A7G5BZK6_9BACL|nr:hypothetical protein [Cohnella cholangitidis]QMV42390.1 hypothetical protein FPL14_15185 [Cohnella cholangitidis]